jgi:hypothetical protein
LFGFKPIDTLYSPKKFLKEKVLSKFASIFLVLSCVFIFSTCGKDSGNPSDLSNDSPPAPISATNSNTQNENKTAPPAPLTPVETVETTNSPIGKFDFKNYTYPLPRGWQDQDGEVTLENGKARLVMTEEEKKIGASYVKTKFGDVTGDGQDEAFVIIKIETGGSALPQVIYIFDWKNGQPEMIWYFRTGDRADGGLRELKAENGELVIELYGQDRFIFGDVETMKVTGDEEQLCCPNYFTRNRYKLTGSRFLLQGKRETYSIAQPNAPPVENMGEIKNQENKKGKK